MPTAVCGHGADSYVVQVLTEGAYGWGIALASQAPYCHHCSMCESLLRTVNCIAEVKDRVGLVWVRAADRRWVDTCTNPL